MVELDLRAPATKDRPVDTWRRLQDAGSVVRARITLLGTPALATRLDTARQVLDDETRFTVDATRVGRRRRTGTAWWLPASVHRLADNLLVYEGDEHRHRRKQVDIAFRRAALEALQPAIDRQTERCVSTLARSKAPCFVRDLARPLPLRIISDLLGLDPTLGDPDTPTGRALARLSSIHGPVSLLRSMPFLRQLSAMLADELEARTMKPRQDLLSLLANPSDGGEPLDRNAAVSMVFMLYLAGHETTTHLLSVGVLELLRNAGGLHGFPTCPDARACSELVRAVSPVELSKPRFVVDDTDLGGHRLTAGSTVAALIGAANHDDRIWSDAESIDPARAPHRHLGFGSGTHACLGLQLALREAAAVFAHLNARMPDMALADRTARVAWAHRTGLRALQTLPVTTHVRHATQQARMHGPAGLHGR